MIGPSRVLWIIELQGVSGEGKVVPLSVFGGFGFPLPASGLRLVAAGLYSAGIAGAGLEGYKIIQAQKHPCERRDDEPRWSRLLLTDCPSR